MRNVLIIGCLTLLLQGCGTMPYTPSEYPLRDGLIAPLDVNGATAVLSGTSMASPHTAGGIALIYDKKPSASSAAITKLLIRKSSKDKITNPGPNTPNRLLFTKRF